MTVKVNRCDFRDALKVALTHLIMGVQRREESRMSPTILTWAQGFLPCSLHLVPNSIKHIPRTSSLPETETLARKPAFLGIGQEFVSGVWSQQMGPSSLFTCAYALLKSVRNPPAPKSGLHSVDGIYALGSRSVEKITLIKSLTAQHSQPKLACAFVLPIKERVDMYSRGVNQQCIQN